MKYIFPLCIIILFSFTSREREFRPPGTVKYNDTLFIDETEVSNFSWKEYETWIKTKFGANSPEHKAALPDTLVWRDVAAYNEPFVEHYYRHPAYKDYPVVGISYEQARAFCKWRTGMVKAFLAIRKKHSELDLEYRLPTKQEWESLSYNGAVELSNNGFNEKGMRKFNSIWEPDTTNKKVINDVDNADVTAPVYSYWKNFFGIYNMIGNVSEMVLEKGISKGGSWRHRLEQCRVGKDIPYEKPNAWLGFRCVCVVKKK
jgi:formylglycine-generating enzyme required for sulfatase activity